MSFSIFIPARYGSTRLPAKVLLKVGGKTILQRAFECAVTAEPKTIVIATDHDDIAEEAYKLGAVVVMTSPDCPNGTARIAEALFTKTNNFNYDDHDVIVNLQADEVLMPASYIKMVAHNLAMNQTAHIATLAKPIKSHHDLLNTNIVKVVKNHSGMAMYFSRSPIPYLRNEVTAENFASCQFWHHIGLYAYRVDFLRQYNSLAVTAVEQAESLEQLRALWHGYNIHVGEVSELPTFEINTATDLQAAELLFDTN
jgi:3-deoxy-manno-octulosonate cytidylyltransferase (CMP-KDO synthetase)